MRGARAAALIIVLPLTGCIFAVDQGGKKGLEKRIEKLEKRIQDLERNPPPPPIYIFDSTSRGTVPAVGTFEISIQGEEPAR